MTQMIKTPKGEQAGAMDPVMLLALWARHIETVNHEKSFLKAGMGKPTADQPAQPPSGNTSSNTTVIPKKPKPAVDYGNPQGQYEYRETIAAEFSKWYKVKITGDHILFTVGGAGTLFNAFKLFNNDTRISRIITTAPYYTLYPGANGCNNLHLIDVMEEPGYRLSAKALNKGIEEAIVLGNEDGVMPAAVLLCDPCNPTGTAYTEREALDIANVLASHPDLKIIIDGAYEEMAYGEHLPLLSACAQHDKMHQTKLLSRVIQMRSGTKGLSAAGERWAVTITTDPGLMTKLVEQNITHCGHAPISNQKAYAQAMQQLTANHLAQLKKHYQPQTTLVFDRLEQMGARMPDLDYKIDATFYVMANLQDLIGHKASSETACYLSDKVGLAVPNGVLSTDEEVAFWLMKEYNIMLQPLSYNGIDPRKGYVRITCGEGEATNTELMQRLATALVEARTEKHKKLQQRLNQLRKPTPTEPTKAPPELTDVLKQAKWWQAQNNNLTKKINGTITQLHYTDKTAKEEANQAAAKIQGHWKRFKKRSKHQAAQNRKKWIAEVRILGDSMAAPNLGVQEDAVKYITDRLMMQPPTNRSTTPMKLAPSSPTTKPTKQKVANFINKGPASTKDQPSPYMTAGLAGIAFVIILALVIATQVCVVPLSVIIIMVSCGSLSLGAGASRAWSKTKQTCQPSMLATPLLCNKSYHTFSLAQRTPRTPPASPLRPAKRDHQINTNGAGHGEWLAP